MSVPLTYIDAQFKKVGMIAAEFILKIINGDSEASIRSKLSPQLIIRENCSAI